MPRTARDYRLVPADIPPRRGAGGGGVYAKIVGEFAASGHASALVEMPGRKPQALALGLRKAAEAQGGDIKVVSRAGQVYLRRA